MGFDGVLHCSEEVTKAEPLINRGIFVGGTLGLLNKAVPGEHERVRKGKRTLEA